MASYTVPRHLTSFVDEHRARALEFPKNLTKTGERTIMQIGSDHDNLRLLPLQCSQSLLGYISAAEHIKSESAAP